MTNSEIAQRRAEIDARLAAATPGEWYLSGEREVRSLPGFYPILIATTARGMRGIPDAKFIAHAMQDIQWQRERIEELEALIKEGKARNGEED